MKYMTILLVCVTIISYSAAKPSDRYTSKYDNIDVDQILNSERLFENYMNCLLDKGRCTPDGQLLKEKIPDGLENGCSKCTDKQKELGEKVMTFLMEQRKDYFKLLEAKYDPSGKYRKRYEEEYNKRKEMKKSE